MFSMRHVLAVSLLPLLMWSLPAGAESSGQLRDQARSAQSELSSVKKQISTAQKKLRLTQAERNKQQKALKDAEQQIRTLQASMAANVSETAQREKRLAELKVRQRILMEDKREQLAALRQDMQQAYRAGQDDYFKLLLNQENPALLARQLRYYGYLQKARSEKIGELDGTLAEIAALEKEEATQIAALAQLRSKLEEDQKQLKVAQDQRAAALKVLNSEIREQDRNLKALKQDQAALQSLMRRLERAAREADRLEQERRRREQQLAREAGKPVKPEPKKPTAAWSQEPDYSTPYKGNCALPASGGIRAQFGAPRGGGLRWNGIVIAAAGGSPVKAVKAGKVLYADFLRGYGKLVIIDHGSGFMSLYGYNQSLQAKVGQSVSAGASIATVGAGSGEAESGLYFETRLRGRPSQPGNWCNY
ncbi:murein hydrolase activator EnvC family protein [Perlucidibaca piscinae]|uniref:murein hydrolase activator EnvC family protein n=1 Tax=Perlucidibaca piscinae TaxID=392589 RepID=UPI0003B2F285|nr:peptidoglycan DD-metalloendopeptidase family protein [Perlucidibaca piscinae]